MDIELLISYVISLKHRSRNKTSSD